MQTNGILNLWRAQTALCAFLLFLFFTSAWGAEDIGIESFEQGIPHSFEVAHPARLSLSGWHYLHGTNSFAGLLNR